MRNNCLHFKMIGRKRESLDIEWTEETSCFFIVFGKDGTESVLITLILLGTDTFCYVFLRNRCIF